MGIENHRKICTSPWFFIPWSHLIVRGFSHDSNTVFSFNNHTPTLATTNPKLPLMPGVTSPVTKVHIFDLKEQGLLSQEVADHVGVHHTTIDCVYNHLLKNPDFYHVEPRSGHPQKLSPEDGQFATLKLSWGHVKTAIDLQHEFLPHIHPDTVHNCLQQQGLSAHKRCRVYYLNWHHISSWLKWARSHQSWKVGDWERVIFSDESKFNLFGSDGLQYCWRRKGQALDPCYTNKQVKHRGGKVMVWGCITAHGVGWLCQVDGYMNSTKYMSILQEGYLRTLEDLHTNQWGSILQSNNDSKHTSKATWAWLKENHISTLDWPASSPDMNIIEILWAHLDDRVEACPNKPSNSTELWKVLQEEWKNISPKYVGKLYESLPRHVEEVCNTKGGSTKY